MKAPVMVMRNGTVRNRKCRGGFERSHGQVIAHCTGTSEEPILEAVCHVYPADIGPTWLLWESKESRDKQLRTDHWSRGIPQMVDIRDGEVKAVELNSFDKEGNNSPL